MGAGRIDTAAAAAATLVACDDTTPGRVALSFGPVEAVGVTRVRRIVRVTAKAATAQALTLSYEPMAAVPGVTVELPEGTTLTVPAGGVATFPVELVVDAAAVHAVRDPGAAASQDGMARHYLVEESGHIVLATSGGVQARVVLHAVIRPASSLSLDVPPSGLTIGTTATTTDLSFSGRPWERRTTTRRRRWRWSRPSSWCGPTPPRLPAATASASIRWLGVTSDAPQRGGVANATLFFGVAVHGPWPSPRDVSVSIDIDTNRDGTTDWRLATTDHGTFVSKEQDEPWESNVFGAELANLGASAPRCSSSRIACPRGPARCRCSAPRSCSWRSRPAPSAWGTSSSQIGFMVTVSPTDSTRSSDSPTITYDVARPGLSPAAGMPPLPLAPGQTLPLRVDRQAFTGRGSGGLLLLVHTNPTGARAAAVPVMLRRLQPHRVQP